MVLSIDPLAGGWPELRPATDGGRDEHGIDFSVFVAPMLDVVSTPTPTPTPVPMPMPTSANTVASQALHGQAGPTTVGQRGFDISRFVPGPVEASAVPMPAMSMRPGMSGAPVMPVMPAPESTVTPESTVDLVPQPALTVQSAQSPETTVAVATPLVEAAPASASSPTPIQISMPISPMSAVPVTEAATTPVRSADVPAEPLQDVAPPTVGSRAVPALKVRDTNASTGSETFSRDVADVPSEPAVAVERRQPAGDRVDASALQRAVSTVAGVSKPSPGSEDPGLQNSMDLGTSEPRDLGTSGPRNPGTSEPRDLGTSGPRDLGTSGPRDLGTPGPRDLGTSGPRDLGTPGPRDLVDQFRLFARAGGGEVRMQLRPESLGAVTVSVVVSHGVVRAVVTAEKAETVEHLHAESAALHEALGEHDLSLDELEIRHEADLGRRQSDERDQEERRGHHAEPPRRPAPAQGDRTFADVLDVVV
jgi:hypothetical protein